MADNTTEDSDNDILTDTTQTVSADSNYLTATSDVGTVRTTTTNLTDKTQEDAIHANIPAEFAHKSRTNVDRERDNDEHKSAASSSRHARRPNGGKSRLRRRRSKSRENDDLTISPSPFSMRSSRSGGDSEVSDTGDDSDGITSLYSCENKQRIMLNDVIDSRPTDAVVQGDKQKCAEVLSQVRADVYFEGCWNHAHFQLRSGQGSGDVDAQLYAEYTQRADFRQKVLENPLWVGDERAFHLLPQQQGQNTSELTFYAQYVNHATPYPLPNTRLRRALFTFEMVQKTSTRKGANLTQRWENTLKSEQAMRDKLALRAKRVKKLYAALTPYQTSELDEAEVKQEKREFWYRLQYEAEEAHVGCIVDDNLPPWIMHGWFNDHPLMIRRNERYKNMPRKIPQMADYPNTARWDRIRRGCYELDWGDEKQLLEITRHADTQPRDPELAKNKGLNFNVLLNELRRLRLFGDAITSKITFDVATLERLRAQVESTGVSLDPFLALYTCFGVLDRVGMKNNYKWVSVDFGTNIWARVRQLYYTVEHMWRIANTFDPDGCLRVPAMVNPIEWQYAVALKLVWGAIEVYRVVQKRTPCDVGLCGKTKRKAARSSKVTMSRLVYAFDFDEPQIYDFRFIEFILRYTLHSFVVHLGAHLASLQQTVIEELVAQQPYCGHLAHHAEYKIVLDYFRFFVLVNNLYEFFSPAQMGELWEHLGCIEELRMVFPEVSQNVVKNEFEDMHLRPAGTSRRAKDRSKDYRSDSKVYDAYLGAGFMDECRRNEHRVWQDAHWVVRQYCMRNTLTPVPDVFEERYAAHNLLCEYNPHKVDYPNKSEQLANIESKKYKRQRLAGFITECVSGTMTHPVAVFLSEIKYPWVTNCVRACIKNGLSNPVKFLMVNMTNFMSQSYLHQIKQISKADTEAFAAIPHMFEQLTAKQKERVAVRFSWAHLLFVEYLSFNPRQFHRQRTAELIKEQNKYRAQIERFQNDTEMVAIDRARKLLSAENEFKRKKKMFDSWCLSTARSTVPAYPLVTWMRFACCERSNAVMDEYDELEREGDRFEVATAFHNYLGTILKFPQLSTRILMNTHDLGNLRTFAYNEVKDIYSRIFKWKPSTQEHPSMFEKFKTLWMAHGRELRHVFDMYHEPHHRLHREVVWPGTFHEFHNQVYGEIGDSSNKHADKEHLWQYYAKTHLQEMDGQYDMRVEQAKQDLAHDLQRIFADYGFAEQPSRKFFGNYYRFFGTHEEQEDEDGNDADGNDGAAAAESDANNNNEQEADAKEPEQPEPEQKQADDDADGDGDDEEEEDDGGNPFGLPEEAESEAEDGGNPFGLPDDPEEDDDGDDEDEEQKDKDKDVKPKANLPQLNTSQDIGADLPGNLDDFDDMPDDEDLAFLEPDKDEEEEEEQKPDDEEDKADALTKTRGSGEYNEDDVAQINEFRPSSTSSKDGASQTLQDIHEESYDEEPVDAGDKNGHEHSNAQSQQNGGGGDGDGGNDQNTNYNDGNQSGANGFGGAGGGINGAAGAAGGGGGGGDGDGDDRRPDKRRGTNASEPDQKDEEDEDDDDDEEEDMPNPTASNKKKTADDDDEDPAPMMDADAMIAHLDRQAKQAEERDRDADQNAADAHANGDTDGHRRDASLGGGGADDSDTHSVRENQNYEDDDDDDDDDDEDEDGAGDSEHDDDIKTPGWKEIQARLMQDGVFNVQSKDAVEFRKEELRTLYDSNQLTTVQEDEEQQLNNVLGLDDTQFIDTCLGYNTNANGVSVAAATASVASDDEDTDLQRYGMSNPNVLVPDLDVQTAAGHATAAAAQDATATANANASLPPYMDKSTAEFSDEKFFQIRNARWYDGDAHHVVPIEIAENSVVMLKDLTHPITLSDLLGDFQKAGQIMLSRIDDMQASLIVENKLHSAVLKEHQTEEKKFTEEKDELLSSVSKLEAELKQARDKRDENKAEAAALKTKQESYILRYNELKEMSTVKLRDQLRCFEIYKAQTTQFERRIHDVMYQTEVGYKRHQRLSAFKREKQMNISHLDLDMESMEKEKQHLKDELIKLEDEQEQIDGNEKVYVERLKEQLRRLGKGMENKEKSCSIFRRNVVEERLRIHAIDDSLKKLRTNAYPTTTSDQEMIYATQQEALRAREKYAEKTQQSSFLSNIQVSEKQLIEAITEVQEMEDRIYAKKWNIIQKSWNARKYLLQSGKLTQMKKWLKDKEHQKKKHEKRKANASFKKLSSRNLSTGATSKFNQQSRDFSHM